MVIRDSVYIYPERLENVPTKQRHRVKTTDAGCGALAMTTHRSTVKLLATTGNACSAHRRETNN